MHIKKIDWRDAVKTWKFVETPSSGVYRIDRGQVIHAPPIKEQSDGSIFGELESSRGLGAALRGDGTRLLKLSCYGDVVLDESRVWCTEAQVVDIRDVWRQLKLWATDGAYAILKEDERNGRPVHPIIWRCLVLARATVTQEPFESLRSLSTMGFLLEEQVKPHAMTNHAFAAYSCYFDEPNEAAKMVWGNMRNDAGERESSLARALGVELSGATASAGAA